MTRQALNLIILSTSYFVITAQASYMDNMDKEGDAQIPIGDPFHAAKNAKNCASNCVIRTSFGSWSLAHARTALPLLEGLKAEDCNPVDRQDRESVIRASKAARSPLADNLKEAKITTTLEVSWEATKAGRGTIFSP